MEKRKEALSRAMADFLEIPKDLILDLPKITIIGRSELYLENHRGIIEYSLTRMRINLVRGFVQIEGDNLEIRALMPEEMSISGIIQAVRYFD